MSSSISIDPESYAMRTSPTLSRRSLLQQAGDGFGAIALAALLDRTTPHAFSSSGERIAQSPLSPRPSPLRAKATSVIQIFCPGGLSHLDTWDHKPELAKRQGTPFDPDGKLQFFASKPGNCQQSLWPFRQHGKSGRWMSDLFPQLSQCVDDIAFIHSMQSKSALHGPAMFMANSGFTLPGFPSMGAWVTYGLGSESDNLPAFVVLPDPRGLPPGGVLNWGAGFLPAVHQGTALNTDPTQNPIPDLFPDPAISSSSKESDAAGREFLRSMNRSHAASRSTNSELEARIAAYELAARLQLSAPEITELRGETDLTKRLYSLDHPETGPFGRQCLLARRLVERGVRFIQIFCGAENTTARKIRPNWDSHEDLVRDHGYWGAVLDAGASALLRDLQNRGLLESTLVICTTEFGRQPAAQGKGRDHNAGAFTAWLAGGGIRGGTSYGSTDPLGYRAEQNPAYSYDLHATALHLLGIDHEQLGFYHNGIKRRLTDVHGHVLHPILQG